MGSIPGVARFPGEGHGNPLQCSCPETPWTEKPAGLRSRGSQRIGHDWSDLARMHICQLHLNKSERKTSMLLPLHRLFLIGKVGMSTNACYLVSSLKPRGM